MNRNVAKEFYPILQAYAEGKVIECRTKPGTISTCVPNEWTEMKEIEFWNNIEYRIKPGSNYRPFKDTEECWTEMQKHQPFGWLKSKDDGHFTLITVVDDDEDHMALSGNSGWDFLGISKTYTFADGAPFGVKIEKEE